VLTDQKKITTAKEKLNALKKNDQQPFSGRAIFSMRCNSHRGGVRLDAVKVDPGLFPRGRDAVGQTNKNGVIWDAQYR